MKAAKFKELFNIPATQKRGFLLLGIILLLTIFTPAFYRVFFFEAEVINYESNRHEIESFLASVKFKQKYSHSEFREETMNLDNSDFSSAKRKLTPIAFNPNNLPSEKWMEMGFSKRQVESIKKYEQKGGRFYTKADVKKLWAISEEEYAIIEPFILLPDTMSGRREFAQREPKVIQVVELNSADTTALKTLPGIGSSYAKRIYDYKMRLGGFHTKSQLWEVRGMDSTRYWTIDPYIDVNPWLVRRINVNTADFYSLSSHPYINNNVAISLINYRNRHGRFVVPQDIMKSELVDEDLYSKLAPYLTTD
jgi:competence protein ComEA